MPTERGTVHQPLEDNSLHLRTREEARQGAVSGRIVTVLIVSTFAVGAIFAVIWLATANL